MQAQDQCCRFGLSLLAILSFASLATWTETRCLSQSPNALEASEKNYSPEIVDALVAAAKSDGDFSRGLRVYTQAKSACFSCHKIGEIGGPIGPELTKVTRLRSPTALAESLLWPNRTIAPEFQVVRLLTSDGNQFSGYVSESESTDAILAMIDPATQSITKIERSDIESQSNGLSLMPNGLVDSLNRQDQIDLLRFLIDLGTKQDGDLLAIESTLRTASTHEPSKLPLQSGPIHPEKRPASTEYVNRDRIYDFYTKQAAYFSKQSGDHSWLETFPGLDGAGFGHWGNQNEAYWEGGEWNDAIPGLVQCNVFISDAPPVARAVCFRLGDGRTWSACFDPTTLSYTKLWTGGFLKYSSVRHGFMDGVRMVGNEQSLPEVARPLRQHNPEWGNAEIRYLGYYMHNDQILFHLSINGTEYLDTPRMVDGVFERIVAPKQNHPLNGLLQGGRTQWPDIIETDITLGKGNGLVVDTIALPTQNPWRTIVSCGDHGFLADGTAIVVTMQGDVWRVENIAYDSSKTGSDPKARWRRIANGLHQALGVWVQNDEIYVLGRNQVTRLHDLNGDHEIDRYECFSDSFVTSPGGHDFICGLQRDDQGNFYTASGNQGILQISPDGKTTTVIATGFRNPDGIGILPDGTITVPSSEGDWTPTSMIAQIHPRPSLETGKRVFETAPIPFYGYRGPAKDQKVELPLVYLPRGIDNSSGGQVWIDDARMGPLDQKIVHTSFGAGTAFVVLRDRVDNMWQGGIVPLPGEYRAGVHRAHLNKKDGQLYLSGMNGWGSYTPDAGCFQRLRYTGSDIQMIDGFHVHSNGVSVRFTQPVNRKMAEDASSHFAQCWNYRYSPGYGSKEYSALHPPMIGHDRLRIQGAYLAGDNQTLFLEIPELQRCNQLHLYLQIDESEPKELFATVHALDADKRDIPNYRENTNKVLAPHPMERDLEWLQRSIPNPWQKRLEQARNIRIESRDNLQFSTKTLEVTAGERLKLNFGNPDVVPHNWALLKPNTLQTIGELANRMVNDPDAYLRHYVPDSQDVICYTDVVDPKAEFSIYFEAPSEPGKYPYLCTFPGHWMVMNGEMIVKPK